MDVVNYVHTFYSVDRGPIMDKNGNKSGVWNLGNDLLPKVRDNIMTVVAERIAGPLKSDRLLQK